MELTELTEGLKATGTYGLWIIVSISVLLLLIALIVVLIYVLSHKHIFKVLTKTQGNTDLVLMDKAKIKKDNTGKEVWHLLKLKKNAPPPPLEVRDITPKGRLSVQAYYDEKDDIFQYVKKDDKISQEAKEHFTASDKIFAYEQYKKATLERSQNVLSLIKDLAVPVAFVILIICILVFWESVAKPSQDMAQMNTQVQGLMKETSENFVTATEELKVLILTLDKDRPTADERPD